MLAAPEANFEETFGENKAADAWFVLGSELKEPDKVYPSIVFLVIATFEISTFEDSI